MAEKLANRAATYLAEDISDSDLTMTVTGNSDFPDSGNFRVRVEDELILVTAVDDLIFTITRGTEGTTAASHSSPARVTHVLTVAGLNQYMLENQVEDGKNSAGNDTYAGKGVATTVGKLYLPSDDCTLLRANGTNWDVWQPIHQISRPAATDYSLHNVNQTGFTTNIWDYKGHQYFHSTRNSQGADHLHIMKIANDLDTSTITFIGCLVPVFGPSMEGEEFGICLVDAVNSETGTLGIRFLDGSYYIVYRTWSGMTSLSTRIPVDVDFKINQISPIYLRIYIDGSVNWHCSYSCDGQLWIEFDIRGQPIYAPKYYGVYHNSVTTAADDNAFAKPGHVKILKLGLSTLSSYN